MLLSAYFFNFFSILWFRELILKYGSLLSVALLIFLIGFSGLCNFLYNKKFLLTVMLFFHPKSRVFIPLLYTLSAYDEYRRESYYFLFKTQILSIYH